MVRLRGRLLLALTAAVLLPLLLPLLLPPAAADDAATEGVSGSAPGIRVHRIEGMIHGVTAGILERALRESAERGDKLFILEMDTPGGLVDATEDMVRALLNSPVPTVSWVGPRGAHAASAGFFLLLATDVAAMAPVTRTGASSVINAFGGEQKEGDIALKKASADLRALIRSAARLRGRPADLAEQAVSEARSWSAEEAFEAKLIDLIVPGRDELIAALDGREVRRADGSTVRLALAGLPVLRHGTRWTEDAKNVLLHPTVLALMLSLAVLGIYIEMTNPGLILPGVAGVIGLLIFLYGTSVLPVRTFAAGLLALGVLAFILEIKVVSYGLLAITGTVLVALGLWLLFPSDVPGLAVPLMTIIPLIVLVVAVLGVVTFLVARAYRAPVTTGREGLVGEEGEVTSAIDPADLPGREGTVALHGELWRARSSERILPGVRVRVVGSEGLLLYVEPARRS